MLSIARHLPGLLVAVASLTACASGGQKPDTSTNQPLNAMTTPSSQKSSQLLSDHHWQLVGAQNAQGKAESGWLQTGGGPVSLRFRESSLNISGLCNNMGAGYTLNGQRIQISHVAGTMKMCANEAQMRYEQQFSLRLPQAQSWEVAPGDKPILTLTFKDGGRWTFQGKPTHEALYGGPGETLFLEVAPQRVACHHPLMPKYQCLKVREISYDASGIKRKTGDWELFYSEIENYQHQPDVRNVLRLKRYTRQHVPADASRYVYVLDMVVESENMATSSRRAR